MKDSRSTPLDAKAVTAMRSARFLAAARPKPFEKSWAVYDTTIEPRLLVHYAKDEADARKIAERWNAGRMPEAVSTRLEALHTLRGLLKPGDEVHTILRHVSRSGMMRHISLVISSPEGMRDITWHTALILGDKRADDGGIKTPGCGMDMGFHLVYNLSRSLWPEGFTCAGEKCPGSEHCNRVEPPAGTCLEHAKRKASGSCTDVNCKPWVHTGDGGYALRQRWL